ncbi:MAG: caspase family protein [Hyphomonadaceae bacterium]|nr:caspase family protein [Hyphomonadaceae bacterium]
MTRFLLLVITSLLFALMAYAEQRLALVIHQKDYSGDLSVVRLAETEADQIADALRATGFEVTRASNLNKSELDTTLDNFRIRLERAGTEAVGVVYYTGHGAQDPRTRNSYLLGVNAKLRAGSDFARYGVSLATQRDAFGATGAKAVFLIFDACRNTPAIPGFKADLKGLQRVNAAANMLIAYSTSLDDLAEEGRYAPILAEEIKRPGQSAELAFLNAQKRVARQTGNRQRPWSNFELYNDVYFNGQTRSAERPRSIERPFVDAPGLHDAALAAVGEQDFDEGNRLYRLACLAEYYPSCVNLGWSYWIGRGVEKTPEEAVRFFQLACDASNSMGCVNLGLAYQRGEGVTKDEAKALELYEAACNDGQALGCNNVGWFYGQGVIVNQDRVKAREYYERACNENVPLGCQNLGSYYYLGYGGAKDPETGAALLRANCRTGHEGSCNKLDEFGLSR